MRKLKTPQDVRRRNFLKTVASSGIATSALKASTLGLGLMASRAGFAAGPNGIKRVVIVYIPDGCVPGTYQFNSDGSLGESAAPLESVKGNLVIFDGCTTRGGGHGDGGTGVLGGNNNSDETYDITLEGVIGDQTPFPSLQLGVESDGIRFSRRNKESIGFTNNPRSAFTRLFGDTVGEVPEDARLIREPFERNLLEIQAFKSKLSAEETRRLDQHEAAIQKIISNLENAGDAPAGCTNRVQNNYGWENTGSTPEIGSFTQVCNMQIDTLVAALSCNLTNLVTLALGTDAAEFNAAELPDVGTFHTTVHSGRDEPYIQFRAYLSERFAYLISQLKNTPDPDLGDGSSLLDTTLVLQVTCMGNGNAHDQANAPFAMATATKNMVGGRGFSVTSSDELLDTVSAALGVQDQMPQYGSGPAGGLLK
ncbi:DUF1552 domain-containing protein [Marinicellulosiphila megalodicopiae]|uniref:DUF1552 domain-containing protein n=1 Tax=Marinicellulosiphila megalodicopiae TaxID=2724896 RepID=UPI003BAECC9D